MGAWIEVVHGNATDCEAEINKTDVPESAKAAVGELLALYPGPTPVAKRTIRRPKDSSRPIDTAQSPDGSSHAVGNFEDVTITHEGHYRVTVQGNPDDYGTIQILIEPYYANANVSEKPA